ncbi:MAG TPA: methyltransferase domain-containing protein, partial [Candidatus Synoicihabitans sp.]|nr:methyltransferase domain-containing protein [Candidatus Synoicihabitans sp.]
MPYAVAQPLRDQRVAHLRIRLADLPLASGNVTLELGCGHGHFLTAYAAAHPEQLCLGIDLLADRLQRAQRKSSRQGVSNVVWLQAEALDFLRAWPVSARLDRI